ncbi:MAG TPA: histidine kinase [Bryobacteraceae bacterium]|nr:histidine kinase [Bryobacteraceae bacterium]
MKGKLKVYLGYAAGVGKTYRMLDEAQTLRQKGVDVVIGYFEPHGRKETIAKIEGLEVVPRRPVGYANTSFEEMDTDAILRRKPQVAVVDEFAHTNVPGCERAKRWQDVDALLDAGIDVLTTVNVQHLESLNDQVYDITGVRVRETVPDWVIDTAAEVVFVDLTPRALRNRLERGVVYAPDKAQKAMENFFTESNLSALREIAMRHAAHELEEKLEPALSANAPVGGHQERILVCLTGRPTAALLIRRARRVADYLQAGCLALYVCTETSGDVDERVKRHMSFARNLRIQTHVVKARDIGASITEFAGKEDVTQIFMGRSAPLPWYKPFEETLVQQVVRQARNKQITIVAERRR